MSPSTRRKARRFAMQATYQWQMTGDASTYIEKQFFETFADKKVDVEFFSEIFHGVTEETETIDALLTPALDDRKVTELDPVEKALLRVACFELKQRMDVPYRVVINEAIEIAKEFGAVDSHKFVNGVLDKLVPTLREVEFKAKKRS